MCYYLSTEKAENYCLGNLCHKTVEISYQSNDYTIKSQYVDYIFVEEMD